ncbi:hypothetical protein KOR34_32360 [Posidoniimonas corsicana]|uniref:Thioredoxin domain-containing protein n=1 Tax=Posidoniimonas corsicana TaxID=1938618 RepID=A0A5C5VJY7_9BACT|nr:DUF899 domain-containing protein [Posidoniimonas corsicana]TWT38267.1 hypothetical protein KOR34_32360 [Posidoniimonas corsicana]
MTAISHPPVVNHNEWLARRKDLLAAEKELTRQYDRITAMRRRLPMERVQKAYRFTGPNGELGLPDLFEGRRQLIVYHFMYDPDWDRGCSGCTDFVNALGNLSMLAERDTTLLLVSRAPYEKLAAYKEDQGWTLPWCSSHDSDFNYDYHVTLDRGVVPLQHNYRDEQEVIARSNGEPWFANGETHGLSVFFSVGGEPYHTYSTYARGVERLTDAYSLLDQTPYGRQEDFEESPPGWPQRPTYGG